MKEGHRHDRKHPPEQLPTPKRFHGWVVLDTTRVGRDAGRIAEEVISTWRDSSAENVRSPWKSKPRSPPEHPTTLCAPLWRTDGVLSSRTKASRSE